MSSNGFIADGTTISIGITDDADTVTYDAETYVVGEEITGGTLGGSVRNLIEMTTLAGDRCYRKAKKEINDSNISVNFAPSSASSQEFEQAVDQDTLRWLRFNIEGKGTHFLYIKANINSIGDIQFTDQEKLVREIGFKQEGDTVVQSV